MTIFDIKIQNENKYVIDIEQLLAAATAVLRQHEVTCETSLTIVITDDESITALNKKYRDIHQPTDILSFPAEKLPAEIEEASYLGDLVIAYPYAAAQAEREGHDLSDSLGLLVVHGTLHLLGYEHDTEQNRLQMWAAQDKALEALGISQTIVPALESNPYDE